MPERSPPRAFPLFDAAECARTWDAVRGAERFWTPRHATARSFTLGAAAYLDIGERGVAEYLRQAVRGNTLLRRRFSMLYERLRAALEGELRAPVEYTDRYALPGFHIFEAGETLRELEPKLHFDLQDLDLDWDDGPARGPGARLSYTVAIALPEAGAGLHMWNLEADESGGAVPLEVAESVERTTIEYRLGELFLHSGDRLHQIAGDREVLPGEARVTLQGHARLTRGVWVLYW